MDARSSRTAKSIQQAGHPLTPTTTLNQLVGDGITRPKVKTYKQRKAMREKHYQLKEMRANLPKLSKTEIRRFRLPFHEALLAELEEDGYFHTAKFLSQLMEYQEAYRADHSYDVIIQARPVLKESNDQLTYLYDNLKKAETAHIQEDIELEIEELLKIAYKNAFGPVDWWWLGEQVFAQCLNITTNYRADDRFRHTMTYYLYGKYLIEQPRIIPLGMQFLNIAREYSKDKLWSAGKITGHIEKYIFIEVSTVLYHTLMDQAKAVLSRDPAWALELTLEARERGIDACLPRADVFHLLGQCEMANQQADKAVSNFMKAFLLYKTNHQMEECCEAMIGLAQAYYVMGDFYQNKEQMEKLLKFAQKQGLKSYIGQAHLYIGQYFLNEGSPEAASPYLTNALNIFHEINDVARREFVKNLGAVSKGQLTFQSYVKLILRCEDKSDSLKRNRNLARLLKWKDSREPFWDDLSESCSSASLVAETEEEDESKFEATSQVEEKVAEETWEEAPRDEHSIGG
ncbi:uncharacterized protein [Atheta coriaria]|uniref:uncharacterized protein n=1 Tax=Dalotia coriaria TaxID=877792 RepID=UPI0031F46E45